MMVLVTGGSGSGKSAFAEEMIVSFGKKKRYYFATMYPYDEESHKRILRHRKMREDKDFQTVEQFVDIGKPELVRESCALLECMSNLVANEMFLPGGAGADCVPAVERGIRALKEKVSHLVIVTNEIFSEGLIYGDGTDLYMKNLGEINASLARMADEVYEVVYGIPIMLKGNFARKGGHPR